MYILCFFVLVYPENSEAQYFADQTGVFEIVQAKDITHGKVMKQVYTYLYHGCAYLQRAALWHNQSARYIL